MCVNSILSHIFFSLTCPFGVFGVMRNHPIIPLPPWPSSFHLFPSPHGKHCVAVCGCAFPSLHSPPLLPLMVKERMRLEREEATRLLEEETEVRHSSGTDAQTKLLSVQKLSLATKFFFFLFGYK